MSNTQAVNAVINRLQQQVDDLRNQFREASDAKHEALEIMHRTYREKLNLIEAAELAEREIERQRALIEEQQIFINKIKELSSSLEEGDKSKLWQMLKAPNDSKDLVND